MSVTSIRTNLFNKDPKYVVNEEEDAIIIDDIEGLGLKIQTNTHIDPFMNKKWYESI